MEHLIVDLFFFHCFKALGVWIVDKRVYKHSIEKVFLVYVKSFDILRK